MATKRIENWPAVQKKIEALITQHGGLRAAARVIKAQPSHLSRMRNGTKQTVSGTTLRKLGFEAVVVMRELPKRSAKP